MSTSTQPLQPLQDLLKNAASLTGLPLKQLEDQTKDLKFAFFEFQGQILVGPDAIDPIIDQWADNIKEQLQASAQSAEDAANAAASSAPTGKAKTTRGRSSTRKAPVGRRAATAKGTEKSSSTAKKAPAKAAEAKKPAAKTATKPPAAKGGRGKGRSKVASKSKAPGIPNPTPAASIKDSLGGDQLALPPGFADMVSTRYDSTLSKVLPSDPSDRKQYLTEITQESQVGQNFLNQLAVTLERKYKGRVSQQRAYDKLLAAATALAA